MAEMKEGIRPSWVTAGALAYVDESAIGRGIQEVVLISFDAIDGYVLVQYQNSEYGGLRVYSENGVYRTAHNARWARISDLIPRSSLSIRPDVDIAQIIGGAV